MSKPRNERLVLDPVDRAPTRRSAWGRRSGQKTDVVRQGGEQVVDPRRR